MTKTLATEVAKNCPDSTDLELIGIQDLVNCEHFKDSVNAGAINDSHLLRNVIGLNQNFYYSVQCVPNSKSCSTEGCVYERGVGYLYEKDNRTFLHRTTPVLNQYSDNVTALNNTGTPRQFDCCNLESTVIVCSISPPTYAEALAIPNSVLCSSEGFLPHPVQLQQKSFLARLYDDIVNLSFECDEFVNIVINSLCSFTKQIKLKTSKLCVKRIQADIIDISPSKFPKATKGSLYYDESDDTLKFYDGKEWKTLAWTKE